MTRLPRLFTLLAPALLSACSATGPHGPMPAQEQARPSHAAAPPDTPEPMQPMQPMQNMQSMQNMRERMREARTPAERQAIMAEHAQTMHEGMAMMEGMRHTPADPALRLQMMERRLDALQTTMELLVQREACTPAPPTARRPKHPSHPTKPAKAAP